MSTYEKVASLLLVLLALVIFGLWFSRPDGAVSRSDFDESTGQDFRMGPFAAVVTASTAGGLETNCGPQQPVIVAALHDIDERLASQAAGLGVAGPWEDFEVNAQTLGVLCNKTATIVLRDTNGDTLTVSKRPFERAVPQGGSSNDVGTIVSLTGTIALLGSTTPETPQATARVLIPDRFLDGE